MTDLRVAGAVPVEVKINEDTIWKFSPLTLRDIAEINQWARQRVIESAYVELGAVTSAERIEVYRAINPNLNDMIGSEIDSIPGVVHQVYISVRKNHPDVTEGMVEGLLPYDKYSEVAFVVRAISLGLDPEDLLGNAPKPEAKQKKRPARKEQPTA